MTIKLSKMQRHNTYLSTCDILLDGACIGELEVNYGYTRENKLRIDSYFVYLGSFAQFRRFNVNGRWETKGAVYTQWGWESTYQTHTNAFPTAKTAKTSALAFIKQFVD